MEISVRHDEPAHRYVIEVDGTPVGFTEYQARPGLMAFVHTEVDERLEGHGLASRLIGEALADARARGQAVLPFCPFVDAYLKRHPGDVDLVPAQYREHFGLAAA